MAIFQINQPKNFVHEARSFFQCDNRLKLCTSAPPPPFLYASGRYLESIRFLGQKIIDLKYKILPLWKHLRPRWLKLVDWGGSYQKKAEKHHVT